MPCLPQPLAMLNAHSACIECAFETHATCKVLQNPQLISTEQDWINLVHTQIQWLLITVTHQFWEGVMDKDKQNSLTLRNTGEMFL